MDNLLLMAFLVLIFSGYLHLRSCCEATANATAPAATTNGSRGATDLFCRALEEKIQTQLNPKNFCLHKTVLTDCCDSLIVRRTEKTGIYWILDDRTKALCDNDFEGGGWLKMLRNDRKGSFKFTQKGWKKYVRGFGNRNKNFIASLRLIHRLTEESTMQLRVDLTNGTGKYWAMYEDFAVGGPETFYKLRIGNFSGGNLRDLFSQHNNGEFATADHNWPNPNFPNLVGGWWFKPNGGINFAPYSARGIFWHDYETETDLYHLFDVVEIRIRSRRFPCTIT